MNTIKFRFFNYASAIAHGDKRTIVRELIRLRSWPHIHMEVELPDRNLSFSSTNEDAVKGCRLKRIRYSHPWWDTIEQEVNNFQLDEIWRNIHKINGKKYDLIGLLSYATSWKIILPARDRYWCSEACLYVVSPMLYTGKTEITPEAAYLALKGK